MVATMIPVEQAARTVILRNITWPLYRQLLARKEDSGNPRFAYNNGTLEITVPSFEHEEVNRLLARLYETIAEEVGIDYINAGSTTFDRQELEQGFEPDTCFYVQHAEAIRGKRRINLKFDPPPDLVIEIDITSPSLNKFPIFAGFGIPEIWRYHNGEYHEQPASAALPGVTGEQLTQFITASRQAKRADWLREIRAWAQTLKTDDRIPS